MGGSYDVTEMCYGLSTTVTEILGAGGAGVSVTDRDGNLKFVTATSQPILEIEQVQEETQDGPCVAAFTTRQAVVVSDISARSEWTTYVETARRLGLSAVVGFPLAHGDASVGAMNIYSFQPREWSEDDLDILQVIADMATAYLSRTSELAETKQLADQLQRALNSRIVIEQAKGIVASQKGITVDEAFQLIRAHSRTTRSRLSDVASSVVKGLRLPE
jgi:GAF domain-containing protein